MEEKRKVNLSTIILIIIVIVLIIALGGMWYYYNHLDESNTNEKVSENNEMKEINKKDDEKEIVYTSYSKYSSEYSYSLPYINIDSEDAERINKEIEDEYMANIKEELENEKNELSIILTEIKYNSYINDDILSIVISSNTAWETPHYKAYNIDMYTGRVISNSELIAEKNITEEELLNKLKTSYEEKFKTMYESQINSVDYNEQLENTISEDNYSIETPIFLDEDGTINVIAKIYSLAGADAYYHIIDTKI